MEELYPGKASGDGFHVAGFANVNSNFSIIPNFDNGKIIAGIRSFGRGNMFIYQTGATPNPSFDFRPLTSEFITNIISDDEIFEFSILSKRIGDVTYISGAEAREYGGEVKQGIISLKAAGRWNRNGLILHLSGDLGDRAAFLDEPTPQEFVNETYVANLEIPWMVLRFLLFENKGFVIDNFKKYSINLEKQ